MRSGILAFLAAAAATFLVTPLVRWLAVKVNAVDRPDRQRKLHRRLIPLGGGLAVAVGLAAGIAAALAWSDAGRASLAFQDGIWRERWLFFTLAGAVLLTVGLVDDIARVPPKVKLAGHLAAAALMAGAGFFPRTVILPGAAAPLALWMPLAVLFACLWLAFAMNAFNFIDGLDGLAPGYAALAGTGMAIAMGVLAGRAQDPAGGYWGTTAVVLAAATAGTALGFWRYNRHPARIFLGDAGSTLLGFGLALAALAGTTRAVSPWSPLIPVMLLGWPIVDTLLAIARRVRRGEPMSKADHRHLHHRLEAAGFAPGPAVALIHFIAAALAVLGVVAAVL